MAITYQSQFYAAMRQQEDALDAFYARLLALLLLAVSQHSAGNRVDHSALTRSVQQGVNRAFLPVARVDARGIVYPQSDYFRVLWNTVSVVSAIAISRHAALMRDLPRVEGNERATLDYLDGYLPPTQRVLSDGKTLPERVANVAGRLVNRINKSLAQAETPTDARIALATMLSPTDFDGKRLARSEALLAYTWIGLAAARLNPRVDMYEVYLAAGHPCCDVCDTFAQNSPYALSNPTALPPYHANCVCGVRWIPRQRRLPDNLITPVSGIALLQLLLREQR